MTRLISPRVLLALGVVALLGGAIVHAQRTSSSAAMATAAENFLASLTPEQRQQATFQFDSAERLRWHFVPRVPAQRPAAQGDDRGAAEARAGAAEDRAQRSRLQDLHPDHPAREHPQCRRERQRPDARSERYRFTVFGTPDTKGTWGWRVEGHHVSLHFNS